MPPRRGRRMLERENWAKEMALGSKGSVRRARGPRSLRQKIVSLEVMSKLRQGRKWMLKTTNKTPRKRKISTWKGETITAPASTMSQISPQCRVSAKKNKERTV